MIADRITGRQAALMRLRCTRWRRAHRWAKYFVDRYGSAWRQRLFAAERREWNRPHGRYRGITKPQYRRTYR